jgi:hypothetical protein
MIWGKRMKRKKRKRVVFFRKEVAYGSASDVIIYTYIGAPH